MVSIYQSRKNAHDFVFIYLFIFNNQCLYKQKILVPFWSDIQTASINKEHCCMRVWLLLESFLFFRIEHSCGAVLGFCARKKDNKI